MNKPVDMTECIVTAARFVLSHYKKGMKICDIIDQRYGHCSEVFRNKVLLACEDVILIKHKDEQRGGCDERGTK